MPIHDWTRVKPGIFHHFHHSWIEEIARALNAGILPPDYYAMAEQFAAGLGPDVLTLEATKTVAGEGDGAELGGTPSSTSRTALLLAPPQAAPVAETDMEFYRRKQSAVSVRHVTGDRVVAVAEVVSPGNKSSAHALHQFVEKAADFLDRGIHLAILDLFPPGRHNPRGIHAAIWEHISGQEYAPPEDRPLTMASYECDLEVRAYVEQLAVGSTLPDSPLFLTPRGCVSIPLERSYQTAWQAVPIRWRSVIDPRGSGE
jgi:hypothetical protein